MMGIMEEAAETNYCNRTTSMPTPSTSHPNSEDEAGVSHETSSPSFNLPKSKAMAMQQRSNSFQRWRRQMQRAWKRGPATRDQNSKSSFNPELLTNQKRQWYRNHIRTMERMHMQHKEPSTMFEQFLIVGLPADANVETIEHVCGRRKTWHKHSKSELIDFRNLKYRGPPLPTLEPEILFQYPTKKRIGVRISDIPAFCFPTGVKAQMLEKTPSMSDLNQLIYGQEHMRRDDLSFSFSLKVADNATFYGVCLHVQEIVQRLPAFLGLNSPASRLSGRGSQYLVSAPRCYCILTRLPFFELHYQMLNSIIAQERLDRITHFVTELSVFDSISPAVSTSDQTTENSESLWGTTESPKASSASNAADNEVHSCHSPGSASTSEVSDFSQTREKDKDNRKGFNYADDSASEVTSESRSDSCERMNGNYENGHTSDVGTIYSSVNRTLERLGSSESLRSSVRSMGSEDDDTDEVTSKCADDEIIEWAKENKNDLLQIVCAYHGLPLPPRGSEVIFQPLLHLQPIKYDRPGLAALDFDENTLIEGDSFATDPSEVNARIAAAEEAFSLSVWTTATICRALSLQSVLALFTGVLLEKQVVIICPNLGILSATVLSIIPIIRPFTWQCLFLPVLPQKMHDFLDAPVPFIVGIQEKPADLKTKASNLVCVNVLKDQVKMPSLPPLPQLRELVKELQPIHARLSSDSEVARRPVYKCSEAQAEAAGDFLKVMRSYLESLCSNLRSHTITSVQSDEKVSLLLKDSFIDSFPIGDRPFVKLFVETQLFSVLSDFRISHFETELNRTGS
ncbi:hypothetical protein H6P81_013799 [Aristolochia fimbriata]|uniref:UDENN domain-containing protein n=1 Tax=Aristolochia fimbriata TaxID=158543 RepID=A0AAV7EII2_ARIFI|nr:hypothetical protein H6P81_013799 [Aristolochia fimbriata]